MTINLVDSNANNKAIEQISNAVAGIIQPYKEQELALRFAMSKDPDLAQKLADLEAVSPGSIRGMAGPNAEQYFKGVDPSVGAKTRIGTRGAVENAIADPDTQRFIASKVTAEAAPGAIQQDKFTGALAAASTQALAEDPNLAGAGTSRKITGALPDKVSQAMSNANAMKYKPQVDALVQTGQLIPEFQKQLDGQPSMFTGEMLDAAFLSPYGKELLIPYIEQNKMARVRELASTRFALGDKSWQQSLDKIILTEALKVKANSSRDVRPGDLIKLFGGSEEMIAQYGGSTPEGLVAAQQALDDNADKKFRNERARDRLSRNIRLFSEAKTQGQKMALLQNIKEDALELNVPVIYDMDKNGKLIQLGGDVTPTQQTPTRTPESVNVPESAPTSGSGGGSGRSTRVSGGARTSTAGGTAAAAKHKAEYEGVLELAPQYTQAELKSDPLFKTFTAKEQEKILAKAQK